MAFDIKSNLNTVFSTDSLEFSERFESNSIDLIVADGPYAVTTHGWDKVGSIQEYNLKLIKIFNRVLKPGGVAYLFGKANCIDFIDYRPYLQLNSKIIWYQPSRLAQGRISYTNNYDIICYFTKGKSKTFDLDAVRVPQLVELTQRLRCESVPSVKNGKFSKTKFNSKGKNPGDVWGDIKQLTYRSKELVNRSLLNTIQKPIKLIERLVLASSKEGDVIWDPFVGSGTLPLVAAKNDRNFIGCEISPELANLTKSRLKDSGYDVKVVYDDFLAEAI